ncbi:MAG: divergent PAP2 family protein [Clostridiales bacterium]|nr:divergent PAP2 family protein [Clostridiales bacterium]
MGFSAILDNGILATGAIAWLISQAIKTVIHLILNRRLVWERLVGDGGMPSSHSATVTAVAAATGMACGFDSPLFALACVLAAIVMHDAMGVRQETGKQAKAINNMMEMFAHLGAPGMTPEEQLKEFVGHTPLQVAMGFLLGLTVAAVRALV